MTFLNTHLMTVIVYIAVISQIFTISIIFANKWYKRKTFLLEEYSPENYPNLYVQSSATEHKRMKFRRIADRTIASLSFVLVLFFYLSQTALETVASSILIIAAVQLMPWGLSRYWSKENDLLMAKNFPSTKRKSSFQNRIITDFVSPPKLVTAVLSYVFTVMFAVYIFIEQVWGEQSSKALLLILINTLMVSYLAWLLFNSLYGKKKDNFISSDDRLNLIAGKCQEIAAYLTMYSAFIFGICLIKTFDLSQVYISVLAGIFLQLIFVFSLSKTTEINYEVYKQD